MVERVRDNQTGLQNRQFKRHQFIEGLKDPQVWAYGIVSLTTTLPTSGLGGFSGIVIKSFGFTTLETQLLAMVLGFYIIIVLLGSYWIVRKTDQNLYTMLGFMAFSFLGTGIIMGYKPNVSHAQNIGLLISYYITLSFWAAQTTALSLISRNIAGQTKKTVAVALNFIFWAAGNAIGTFYNSDNVRRSLAELTSSLLVQGPRCSSSGMHLVTSSPSRRTLAATFFSSSSYLLSDGILCVRIRRGMSLLRLGLTRLVATILRTPGRI